jgi:purine-binding chemotaxis protein CheW
MTRSHADLSLLSTDIRDLLVRRSERIRKPAGEAEVEDDALWVATFSLGEREYAIELPILRAAIPLRSVTPVPRSSPVIIGVFQFQGEIIPALRTAALLATGFNVAPNVLLVVDAGGGRCVALDCAQVPIATTLPLSRYREAKNAATGVLVCVPVPGRGVVHVIDLARLLGEQDWGASDA